MIGSVVGWIAGKLFFGGNKSALNIVPAIVIAVVVAGGAYYAGRGMQALKGRGVVKALTEELETVKAREASAAKSYQEAALAAEFAHNEALIARDAAHQADLRRQSEAITQARQRAAEATQRFESLNNQLVRIHNEAPAVACDIPPDRLSVLEAAARAANAAGTGGATPASSGDR
jgi:hypothetical protein